MDVFFAIPFSYRIFVFVLPFFMVAGQAEKLRRRSDASAPWSWLIWFGLGYGLAEWLVLLAPEPSGPAALRLLRAAITASSLLALLEFGRRQARSGGRSLPGAWIYVPVTVLALIGALQGLRGLDAACRYALGIPGGLLAGLALWRMSPARAGEQRLGLQAAAVALWLTVPVIGLALPNAPLPAAIEIRPEGFIAAAQIPIKAVLALCALGAWTGLKLYRSELESSAKRKSPLTRGCFAAALALSVAIGFAAVDRNTYLYLAGAQSDLSDTAQAAAEPQEAVQGEYQTDRTWEQIMAYRRQVGLNFIKWTSWVVICLIGIYNCWNIGWCVMKRKKISTRLPSLRQ